MDCRVASLLAVTAFHPREQLSVIARPSLRAKACSNSARTLGE